jgi:hypothetical protein
MRNLVFLAFLAALIFAVAGWLLDWYSVSRTPSKGGKTSIQLDFDTNKIKEDLRKGKDKFDDTVENVRSNDSTAHAPQPGPGPGPRQQ